MGFLGGDKTITNQCGFVLIDFIIYFVIANTNNSKSPKTILALSLL